MSRHSPTAAPTAETPQPQTTPASLLEPAAKMGNTSITSETSSSFCLLRSPQRSNFPSPCPQWCQCTLLTSFPNNSHCPPSPQQKRLSAPSGDLPHLVLLSSHPALHKELPHALTYSRYQILKPFLRKEGVFQSSEIQLQDSSH